MNKSRDIFTIITGGGLPELQQLIESDNSLTTARDANGVSALMTSAYYGKQDMVEFLRSRISDLDIFEAAALGDEKALQRFIEEKTELNSLSPDGFTPLHLAAFFNRPAVVRLLVQQGADVNAPAENPSRVRPLHSAAACGSVAIVTVLLDHGADVNARQHGGWTALQAAAKHGNLEMVATLLQYGANPGQQSDTGETALILAANDAVRRLLQESISKKNNV